MQIAQKDKMSLYQHAKSELDRIYDKESLKSDANKWIYKAVLELIKVFSKQGHSGFSAMYCLDIFDKLAHFKSLGELDSNKEEWMEVSDNVYQSRRQPNCFSTDLIYYYNLDGEKVPKWKRLFVKNFRGMKLIKLKEVKNGKNISGST